MVDKTEAQRLWDTLFYIEETTVLFGVGDARTFGSSFWVAWRARDD